MASRENPPRRASVALDDNAIQSQKYTSIGRFQLSISAYGYQRESLGLGAKPRTRNPRIPRCAIAHLRSGANLTHHPRMTKVWIASSLPPSLVELRRTSCSSQ